MASAEKASQYCHEVHERLPPVIVSLAPYSFPSRESITLRLDPRTVILDAASSPDLSAWIVRQQALIAVGSRREPGVIYKTEDFMSRELVWRNETNRFGMAIVVVGAEQDSRFRRLLERTENTPERLILILLPSLVPIQIVERLLSANGVTPDDRVQEVRISIDLMQPYNIKIIRVLSGLPKIRS